MSVQDRLIYHGLSLRQNFFWTLAGNIVYAGCQWGMLIVLAKLVSPEQVGQFALGLAVCAPVIMFSQLALRGIQATDARGEFVFGHYLSLRLGTTFLALLAIALLTMLSGFRREVALIILAVAVAKAFESLSDLIYGLLQQHERMDRIAISMMVKGFLSLMALGLGVYLTASVFWGVAGLAAVWALMFLDYDIRSGAMIFKPLAPRPEGSTSVHAGRFSSIQPCWQGEEIRRLVWIALPLAFSTLLVSLDTNTPRYFIEHYLGERQLGIFAALTYLMAMGKVGVGALAHAAMPRLSKYYAAGNKRAFICLLFKMGGIGIFLGGAGIVIALLAAPQILTLLYRPEYAEYTAAFIWLMVAAAMTYIALCMGTCISAARYFKIQLPLYALVASTTALACFWLIPARGLLGAAAAQVLSAAVFLVLSLAVTGHIINRFPEAVNEGVARPDSQPDRFSTLSLQVNIDVGE
jgi:O-antigen/teichoic acid export membrane protein